MQIIQQSDDTMTTNVVAAAAEARLSLHAAVQGPGLIASFAGFCLGL